MQPGFRRQHDIFLPGKTGSSGARTTPRDCSDRRALTAARERADNCSERCTATCANRRSFAAPLADVLEFGRLNRIACAIEPDGIERELQQRVAIEAARRLCAHDGAGNFGASRKNHVAIHSDGFGQRSCENISVAGDFRIHGLIERHGKHPSNWNDHRRRWRRRRRSGRWRSRRLSGCAARLVGRRRAWRRARGIRRIRRIGRFGIARRFAAATGSG